MMSQIHNNQWIISFCRIAAPFSAVFVFLAPIPTICKIRFKRTVDNLPLLPYSGMVSNCFSWMIYGLLRHQKIVWQTNLLGFLAGTYYCFQFFLFNNDIKNSHLPGTINQHITFCLLILSSTLLLSQYTPTNVATAIIGKEGVLISILLFISPLTTINIVFRKKPAISIPLPFTIACLMSCLLWSLLGIYVYKDFNIYFPNLLGLVSAVTQLYLIWKYSCNKNFLTIIKEKMLFYHHKKNYNIKIKSNISEESLDHTDRSNTVGEV